MVGRAPRASCRRPVHGLGGAGGLARRCQHQGYTGRIAYGDKESREKVDAPGFARVML